MKNAWYIAKQPKLITKQGQIDQNKIWLSASSVQLNSRWVRVWKRKSNYLVKTVDICDNFPPFQMQQSKHAETLRVSKVVVHHENSLHNEGTLNSLISMEFFLFFLRKFSQLHVLLKPSTFISFWETCHKYLFLCDKY